MNLREKLEVARQMERLGMDVIEAGFPASPTATLKPCTPSPAKSKMPHRRTGPLREGGY